NSQSSAKALEAYQPLDQKQRKLEKLRALQILKQSSNSDTLAEISLDTTSLSVALRSAEGATLQAMLNLLSAKMIEQNKYTFTDEKKQQELKKKIQTKLGEKVKEVKQEKEKQEEPKKKKQEQKARKESAIDKLVDAALTYFKEMRDNFIETYKKTLSAISLKNLENAFSEASKLVVRYAYEVPIESFSEFVIEPLENFRNSVKSQIDTAIKTGLGLKPSKAFNSKEIKSLLQKSFEKKTATSSSYSRSKVDQEKLNNSVRTLKRSMLVKKRIDDNGKTVKLSSKDIKLALHR
ncbi:MAG: hypothetical protein LW817_08970, partial [Candidatus Caenarcaniphilales bacterium]|nr:hypothetical protein [Candidatus Caenarcaniphilales bacterium]